MTSIVQSSAQFWHCPEGVAQRTISGALHMGLLLGIGAGARHLSGYLREFHAAPIAPKFDFWIAITAGGLTLITADQIASRLLQGVK